MIIYLCLTKLTNCFDVETKLHFVRFFMCNWFSCLVIYFLIIITYNMCDYKQWYILCYFSLQLIINSGQYLTAIFLYSFMSKILLNLLQFFMQITKIYYAYKGVLQIFFTILHLRGKWEIVWVQVPPSAPNNFLLKINSFNNII